MSVMAEERLTDRKEAILQAVVEEYMATARPVGSTLVTRQSDLDVSSATVRKELGALEEEGFLHQPHTSAGRVPTDKGYRYFVDTLMTPTQLDSAKNERISDFFAHTHGELERILAETSRLLAGVTEYAAVVIGPGQTSAVVRSVQLVRLDKSVLLVVVVLSNGEIERRTLALDAEISDEVVGAAERLTAAALVDDRALPPESAASGDADGVSPVSLAHDVVDAYRTPESADPRVHVGGRSSVAGVFDETHKVAQVLQLFERQLLVVSLIRDVLDRGLRVAIGSETGMQNLNECALVVAPYAIGGTEVGSIGVVGPTHMNYPQALAAVAAVSDELGEALTRG